MTATLAAAFLFLAGLAAGAVAVSATVRLAHGRWAGPLLPAAEAGAAFFGVAAVLLAAVTLALGPARGASSSAVAWLAARQLVAGVLVLVLGGRYVARARHPACAPGALRGAAAAAVAGFAAGVSLWTAAIAIEPAPWPALAALPATEVVGAFVSGLAFTAWAGAARGGAGPAARRDLARLLFGFLLLWAYLGWSIFLPTWYGNVPEEVAFLLARGAGPFRSLAIVLSAAWVLATLLVFPRAAVGRVALLAAATLALVARLLAVVLLVVPALAPRGVPALGATCAGAALVVPFVVLVARALACPRAPSSPAALAGPDASRSESPSTSRG